MKKSANEVVRAALFSAVVNALDAFREESGGAAQAMIRDLGAVHSNTAFTDLPESVQKALTKSTEEALRRLLKEGYVVTDKTMQVPLGKRMTTRR